MNYQKMSKTALIKECRQREKHLFLVRNGLWMDLWLSELMPSIRTQRQLGILQAVKVLQHRIRPLLFYEDLNDIYILEEKLKKELKELIKENK